MSWPVFVINMADNTTRMKSAAQELDQHNIAFHQFEAVNGRQLSDAEVADVYDPIGSHRR
jgi:glycosyl transferase family 25